MTNFLMFIAFGLIGASGFIFIYELMRRMEWFAWSVLGLAALGIPFLENWTYQFKAILVLFGCIWLLLLRYNRIKNYKIGFYIAYGLLWINIAVVSFAEAFLFRKMYVDWLNAIAGLLLIVFLPGVRAMHIEIKKNQRDFYWNIPYYWIFTYSLWNFTFFYLDFPRSTPYEFSVIMASFVVSLMRRKEYVQARGFTLGFHYILLIFFPMILTPASSIPIYKEAVAKVLGFLSFFIAIGYAVYSILSSIYDKKIMLLSKDKV